MELPYIHIFLDKYEKIRPSSIYILHSYSCKNRKSRVSVIKKKEEKKMAGKRLSHSFYKEPICIYFYIHIGYLLVVTSPSRTYSSLVFDFICIYYMLSNY